MSRLVWGAKAREDRAAIMDYIAERDARAALALDESIEAKAEACAAHPRLYRTGRVPDTREAVVRPNYLIVFREIGDTVEILRVLHARQIWPRKGRQ